MLVLESHKAKHGMRQRKRIGSKFQSRAALIVVLVMDFVKYLGERQQNVCTIEPPVYSLLLSNNPTTYTIGRGDNGEGERGNET
jgi:hypothetical protein